MLKYIVTWVVMNSSFLTTEYGIISPYVNLYTQSNFVNNNIEEKRYKEFSSKKEALLFIENAPTIEYQYTLGLLSKPYCKDFKLDSIQIFKAGNYIPISNKKFNTELKIHYPKISNDSNIVVYLFPATDSTEYIIITGADRSITRLEKNKAGKIISYFFKTSDGDSMYYKPSNIKE